MATRSACRLLVYLGLCAAATSFSNTAQQDTDKATLQAAYVRLAHELQANPFGKPLVMQSEEGQGSVRGEVYGVVNFPLDQLNAAIATPAHWCDVMILHLNTKYCRISETAQGPTLAMNIGKKTPQDLAETTRLDFKFNAQAVDAAFLKVVLTAPSGPTGTSNYRVILDAIPLNGGSSFVHLSYSYDFNTASRIALGIYLSTLGSDKVGFTLENTTTTSAPVYVKGLRGLAERNTMRYFLAIIAYLESAHGPEEARLDARLKNWFAATEAYPLQLREIEWKDYLSMKHGEVLRQEKSLPP